MGEEELLVVKKQKDKLKVKVVDKTVNQWSPKRYEKVIANKDFNLLAYFFFDLHNMGYPVSKSYHRFKALLDDPELFFL